MMTEERINDWLEKAISENYIKYYDYAEFTNKEKISSGSFGNVSRANRKDSDTIMALKDPFDLTIEEIINEVNYHYESYNSCISFSSLIFYFKT